MIFSFVMKMKLRSLLMQKKFFLIDIEGVLIDHIESNRVFQDAQHFLDFLRRNKRKFVLLTNTARKSTNFIFQKLRVSGLDIDLNSIINPTIVAIKGVLLKNFRPPIRIFIISEGGHIEDIARFTDIIISYNEPIDAVLLGADREITYAKLNYAFNLILKKKPLIVLGGDMYARAKMYDKELFFLAEGAFAKLLELSTGVKGIYTGKPESIIFETAVEALNAVKEHTIMIGDSIKTDIIGALKFGLDAIFVNRQGKKLDRKTIKSLKEITNGSSKLFMISSLDPRTDLMRIF